MHTGDDFFDSKEFLDILKHYKESPTSLDADDLTNVADYYSYIFNDHEAQKAIHLATSIYPGATAPLSYMAHEALNIKDIRKAEMLVESIYDKSDLEYKLLRVEILVAKNKIREAEQELQNVLSELDDFRKEDFMIDVANIYVDMECYDMAEKWIKRNDGCQRLEYKELKAKTLLGKGNIKESIDIFNELIDHDPYSPKYWNALATAQFVTGDYTAAVTSCDYTLAIDPKNSEGLFTMGNSLYHTGKYDEALKFYNRYIEVRPDDVLGFLNIGTCMVNMGDYSNAIVIMEKAKHLCTPKSEQQAMILQELAFAYSANNQTEEAFEAIEMAEAIPYDQTDLLVLKGHILLSIGKAEKAKELFVKLLNKNNNDPHLFLRIAVSIYDNGYPEIAYRMFKKLFDIAGDDFNEGYSYMALCCQELKHIDEFFHYFILALQHNPKEANSVLRPIFPNGMTAQQYYDYIKKKPDPF